MAGCGVNITNMMKTPRQWPGSSIQALQEGRNEVLYPLRVSHPKDHISLCVFYSQEILHQIPENPSFFSLSLILFFSGEKINWQLVVPGGAKALEICAPAPTPAYGECLAISSQQLRTPRTLCSGLVGTKSSWALGEEKFGRLPPRCLNLQVEDTTAHCASSHLSRHSKTHTVVQVHL